MSNIINILSYDFFKRALLTGSIFAVICSLLGIFVILRKESIIGHTIANTSFLGIVIGIILGYQPTLSALITSLFGALLIIFISQITQISRDSVQAFIAQITLSLAIVLITLLKGYRTDLMQYLFGDILAISHLDVLITAGTGMVALTIFIITKNKIMQITISPELALAAQTKVIIYEAIYTILLSLVIALGIKIIGVILISSFLVIPANIAKLFARNIKQMYFMASLFGILGTFSGLFLSYYLDLPSGATIILFLGLLFLVLSLLKKLLS